MKYLILPLLILLTLPLVFVSTPTEILKLKTFDTLVKPQTESGNFVILNITETDLQKEGGWPMPRSRLAELNELLLAKGATGVGWVIAFPQPDRLNGDQEFADSLRLGPSILATFENSAGVFPKTTGTIIKGNSVAGLETIGVIENTEVLKNATAQGIAVAPVDVDNLVRRLPLLLRTPDGWVSAFGTEVLKVLTGTRSYIITTNEIGIQEIAVRGLPPVKTDKFGRKWISWVDTPETNLAEMNVAGRFVFVGITAPGIMPQLATSIGLLEPHKIQAALSESILIQDSPIIPEYSLLAELLILITTASLVWLFLFYLGISAGLITASLVFIGTTILGVYLIRMGLLIDVTWTLISQILVGATAFYLRFREQFKLRLQIKKQFEHYLDPRQVKQLQSKPELLKLGGEKKTATFLFTDLRGFTALSEKLEPQAVTEIMNRVLSVQTKCVQFHGGMIDKFIGDAMMAIFNAPLDLIDHEDSAISCALDICDEIEFLNVELAKENKPPVAIGIGINTGEAIIGNMGSDTRFDYTAIGDSVNVAARLESATKEQGVRILIGENTQFNSCHNLSLEARIKVKGKKLLLNVYTTT
jgi:adenylate cyclase